MFAQYISWRTANCFGIYGHLGGGKTLTAVEIMLSALQNGFHVITNIHLRNLQHLKFPRPPQITYIDEISSVDFWKLPCGAPRGSPDPYRVCIVLDEVAEFFDQNSFSSPVLKSFMSWLRHSSKRGQFVFLITQKPEFIAKSLRLLINMWIMCDDMAQVTLPFFKICLPFTSGTVRRILFDRYGNKISVGLQLANKAFFGNFYDTAQSIAVAGREVDYKSTFVPPPRNYSFFLFVFALFYFVVLYFYI